VTPAPAAERPAVNPYAVLVLGAMAVSTGAIFARLADAPALVISAYRLGIALLILSPVALWKAGGELKRLQLADLGAGLLSGVFLAIHFALWISSLGFTSVANSTVLVDTIPLWVGVLTPFVTGERVSRTTKVSIAISVAGGILIAYGDVATGGKALLGDLLALGGAVCAAAYILIGRSLRRKLSLLAYVFVCYGCAALVLWTLVLLLGLPIGGYSLKTYGAFCGMAVVSQIIGHSSYNWSLRWLSAGMVAVSLLGEPIGSTAMAYVLFGEGLTWFKVVGGVVILCGIYIAARGETVRGNSEGGGRRA
jgi:drug/metabolite transporter (DMT)-like permease